MAILSKIRERSMALIIVVGLALFAFVLDPSTITDFFNSSKINEVGEVYGEPISRQEYAQAVDDYKTGTNSRATEMQVARTVWDRILRDKIYTKQLEEAGITIGETDIWQNLLSNPSVANNQQFLNEAGLFDENKFKVYLKDLQESEDQRLWLSWQNFMKRLETDFKRQTYNDLINVGLGASLKEAEIAYREDNTLLSGDFVYIPYTSIADSLINVTKEDIQAYIKDNPDAYKVEATRDLSFVKFEIKATDADKEAIKNEVAALLNDRKEQNKVTKSEETLLGLKNTTDYEGFFVDNKSDIVYAENYFVDNQLPSDVSKEAFEKELNDTFGPYEERGFYKISKITDIVQRPDSVKSSHILIPFVGSQSANPSTTKTEEEAKKTADSIFKLVRNDKTKFSEIAGEINPDGTKSRGGDIGWVRQSQAFSAVFDKDFADFIYENKKGKIGVVKTKFGYHIIRIDDQTEKKKVMRLVTFGRQILASQETEDAAFQAAEKFALNLSEDTSKFFTVAKENNYISRPVVGLKVLDENVPGIGNQRQIITWAFSKDTEVADVKRFDVENGFVVAFLTGKTKEGLMSAANATGRVKPILVNQKKAEIIKGKMNGATLNDIATANNNVTVRKFNDIALKSPSITGVGIEPTVVGAMYYAKENQLYSKIEGKKGVFAFVVNKKEAPTELPNYEANRNRIAQERKNKSFNIFEALKKDADIEDNRATYYGVQ